MLTLRTLYSSFFLCRLLNGNQLSGSLPDEIGNLQNLNRLQIDENQISGPIPTSFANLTSVKHLSVFFHFFNIEFFDKYVTIISF